MDTKADRERRIRQHGSLAGLWMPLVYIIVVGGIGAAIEAIHPGIVPSTQSVGSTLLALFLTALEAIGSLLQMWIFWVILGGAIIIKLLWDIRDELRTHRNH